MSLLILRFQHYSYVSVISKLCNVHTLSLQFPICWDVTPHQLLNSHNITKITMPPASGYNLFTLKMEALNYSNMFVTIYHSTQCKILEDLQLEHPCTNVKSHILSYYYPDCVTVLITLHRICCTIILYLYSQRAYLSPIVSVQPALLPYIALFCCIIFYFYNLFIYLFIHIYSINP